MPAVFVHGVPDTDRSWDALLHALDRTDVVGVRLPGFGVETPAGWTATKEDYARWLESELVQIGEPVDLVGHDWGAILVQRVASVRPDLIRTLACGSGPVDAAYEWHAMAQAFQTPDVGEQVIATLTGMNPDELAAGMAAAGTPADLAPLQAADIDARMGDCILRLYRSAVTVGAEWEPAVAAMPARPAVVFHGADDPFVDEACAQRIADR
ncbi:MAG: alpha/beta fold hydrolase, partial [Acidimicrobiia bacterium]|nr:alpha/beta fold hydrolase [Acidimicrobiia bacterium]